MSFGHARGVGAQVGAATRGSPMTRDSAGSGSGTRRPQLLENLTPGAVTG